MRLQAKRRRNARIHDAAAAVASGQPTGPDDRCNVCRRLLTDHLSIGRGIGPVCWDMVLDEAEHAGQLSLLR